MIRTQIQLPEPLFKEVRRVAKSQDWSIAEVVRRGVESLVKAYPENKTTDPDNWKLPQPILSKMLIHDPETLRDLVSDDQSCLP